MKRILVIGIMMLFATGAFAQGIGFYGIGGRLGFVMPESDIDNTFGFGAQADLGEITEAIKLAAFLDFWSVSYDAPGFYGDAEWKYSTIGIGATAKYFFPMDGNFMPYAGAGVGFNIGSSKWEASYTDPWTGQTVSDDSKDSSTDFSFHFVGGGEMELSPELKGMVEVKYVLDGADYFGIWAGVIYMLGQ